MDPDKVLLQYGVPDVGPAVQMDSDGIFLGVGTEQIGAAIGITPTEGITLQAGPAVRITLHPTNGITLQAGPAATGATITLHPINGITLNFGPSTSLKLRADATIAECFNYYCELQCLHSTKAMMLVEDITGAVKRTSGITDVM
jgi:hypothetical protein